MADFRQRLYVSTVAEDVCQTAWQESLGMEIAEFCTAENMDQLFPAVNLLVRGQMSVSDRYTFHMPFNELSPGAVDPLAAALAKKRYRQAVRLADDYSIRKLIVHTGYIPMVYDPKWYAERCTAFWKRFLRSVPEGTVLCLENVMEPSPELLTDIARGVNDARLRLCLDVGHANAACSRTNAAEWVEPMAPWLAHAHLHDNRGGKDLHLPLGRGTAPLEETIRRLEALCPEITYALESVRAEPSVRWLEEKGFLERDHGKGT